MYGSIFAYVAGGIVAFALLAWRFQPRKPTTFGSADWARVWEVFKAGLFRPKGLMVGDWTGQLPVHYDQTHAISFGTTGSGKGVAAVLPNLLTYNRIVLLDPGGENSAIARKMWREAGYEFRCINFFGMHTGKPWELPAHGFNPLGMLDRASPTFEADALVMAQMLIRRDGSENGSTLFFKEAAQGHIRDFIVHIKTAEPKERQNLATIYRYLNSAPDQWKRLLHAMKSNSASEGLVRAGAIALERREKQAPEEFSAIFSTMQEDLNWLTDPRVRQFISRGDVDFSILKGAAGGQEGAVISVVLPLEYNKTHAAISRLALTCAVLEMQRAPLAPEKVLFLIDEAADLGAITRLPDWLATLRKYQVVLWPIFQNIGQVAALYGRGWQTIIANCGLFQLLAVGNDTETAKHIETLLGRGTVQSVSVSPGGRTLSETGRPLLFADEVRRLKDHHQVVIIGNLAPMTLRKTPYWERPELAGLFHDNPYRQDKTPKPGLAARLRAIWGGFFYTLVWLMAPHPVAACLFVAMFSMVLAPLVMR